MAWESRPACPSPSQGDFMRRSVIAIVAAGLLGLIAPRADAALRFVVINGNNGTIITSDLAAGDRPTVTRLSQGSYLLTFRFNIVVFAGHAQRPGTAGDATPLIFTSTYDPNRPREIRVLTLGVSTGQPVLGPMDGRITVIVNR